MRAKQLTAVLLFVDFRKAFDSLHRDMLMKMLIAYGVPRKLLDLIEALYEETVACVLTEEGQTELFQILAGVLQGDTLAPLLFIIAIDYVMRTTLDGKDFGFSLDDRNMRRGGRATRSSSRTTKIPDADFADDLALLSDNLPDAQEYLSRLEEAAAAICLHLNSEKTQYISTCNEDLDILTAGGDVLEKVDNFKYLGSYIADSERDFKVRKGKGSSQPDAEDMGV